MRRRRRWILFAVFVARMEDTRLPKRVMFGKLMGCTGCVGGQEKEWMGCLLDDLRYFGINTDQWTTAAQDEGEWRRTAEQGQRGGTFYGEMDRCRESSTGLRHAVVCPNVAIRTKERTAQSRRARVSSLVKVD